MASGQVLGGAEAQQPGDETPADGVADEEGDEGEKEGEEGQKEAAPPKVFLTPVEAAMLAYKEERRQLAKVRECWGQEAWFPPGLHQPLGSLGASDPIGCRLGFESCIKP